MNDRDGDMDVGINTQSILRCFETNWNEWAGSNKVFLSKIDFKEESKLWQLP